MTEVDPDRASNRFDSRSGQGIGAEPVELCARELKHDEVARLRVFVEQ